MKINFRFILTGFVILSLISCENILDDAQRKKEQENYTTPFMGKWSGNYTGEQNGTLFLNVSKSGSIEVTRSSGGSQEVFYTSLLGGGSGSINNTSPSSSGFELYGNLESKSGTWKMGGQKGNWSVAKN
jgi:hypothetical protein